MTTALLDQPEHRCEFRETGGGWRIKGRAETAGGFNLPLQHRDGGWCDSGSATFGLGFAG